MNAHNSTAHVTFFLLQEAARIYKCLSQQHLSPQVLHQSVEELAIAIKDGILVSTEWKIPRNALACLRQLLDQIPAEFSAKADVWLPSLWHLLLVQPKAPYSEVSIYSSWTLVSVVSCHATFLHYEASLCHMMALR